MLPGNGVRIFSTNAAVTFLMENGNTNVSTAFENLIHFDAQNLQPLTLCYLGEKGDSDVGLTKDFQNNLEFVEKSLKKKFLFGVSTRLRW